MSSNSARRSAVQAITTYKPEASPLNFYDTKPTDIFGCNVFTDKVIKVIEINGDRIRASRKAVLLEEQGHPWNPEETARPQRDRGNRGDRGGRRDRGDRGGRGDRR